MIAALDRYTNYAFDAASFALTGLLLLLLFHAALRVPGKRTPWDRIAGTQVRYRVTRM